MNDDHTMRCNRVDDALISWGGIGGKGTLTGVISTAGFPQWVRRVKSELKNLAADLSQILLHGGSAVLISFCGPTVENPDPTL